MIKLIYESLSLAYVWQANVHTLYGYCITWISFFSRQSEEHPRVLIPELCRWVGSYTLKWICLHKHIILCAWTCSSAVHVCVHAAINASLKHWALLKSYIVASIHVHYPVQIVLHSWLGYRHWRGNHHQTRVSKELVIFHKIINGYVFGMVPV